MRAYEFIAATTVMSPIAEFHVSARAYMSTDWHTRWLDIRNFARNEASFGRNWYTKEAQICRKLKAVTVNLGRTFE